jgi:hypothetical protein
MKFWNRLPPPDAWLAPPAHGGILTGHWEFDLALFLVLMAIVAYSFLLPADAPRGVGRVLIQIIAGSFFVGALALAVIGFRNL